MGVVDLEVGSGRAEPLQDFGGILEDDRETTLGVRVELDRRVKTFPEAAEEKPFDQELFINGGAEVSGGFIGRDGKGTGVEGSESFADTGLVGRCPFLVVLQHLGMYQFNQRLLMELEDVEDVLCV